jgi:hypothetical protein
MWAFTRDTVRGLVIGLGNDGITPVPGVLRLSVLSEDKQIMYQAASTLDIRNRQGFIKRC